MHIGRLDGTRDNAPHKFSDNDKNFYEDLQLPAYILYRNKNFAKKSNTTIMENINRYTFLIFLIIIISSCNYKTYSLSSKNILFQRIDSLANTSFDIEHNVYRIDSIKVDRNGINFSIIPNFKFFSPTIKDTLGKSSDYWKFDCLEINKSLFLIKNSKSQVKLDKLKLLQRYNMLDSTWVDVDPSKKVFPDFESVYSVPRYRVYSSLNTKYFRYQDDKFKEIVASEW